MISQIESGGLKMPSFEFMVYSQKVMWVKRLLNEDTKWTKLALELSGLIVHKITIKVQTIIGIYC